MSNILVSAALLGASLFCGADEPATTAPVTTEAKPADNAPATDNAQGKAGKNDKEKPKSEADAVAKPPVGGDTEPLPDFNADTAPKSDTPETAPEATTPEATTTSDELVRPTEQTDRSSKRVAAFWFISTGK